MVKVCFSYLNADAVEKGMYSMVSDTKLDSLKHDFKKIVLKDEDYHVMYTDENHKHGPTAGGFYYDIFENVDMHMVIIADDEDCKEVKIRHGNDVDVLEDFHFLKKNGTDIEIYNYNGQADPVFENAEVIEIIIENG